MLADKIRSVSEAEGLREAGRESSWAGWAGLGNEALGTVGSGQGIRAGGSQSALGGKELEVATPRPCVRSFSLPPRTARVDMWQSMKLPKLNQTLWASYSNASKA